MDEGIRPGDSPVARPAGTPPGFTPARYFIKVVPRWEVWISATQTILEVESVTLSLMDPVCVDGHGIFRQKRLQLCQKKPLCRPTERASTKPSPSIPFHHVRSRGRLQSGAGTPEKPPKRTYEVQKGAPQRLPACARKGRHRQIAYADMVNLNGVFRKKC